MVFVYIDESGDLCFSEGSSKVFVVGYLACNDPLILQRSLKRIRQGKLKKELKDMPEFKFYEASDKVKGLVFERLGSLDITCGYVAVNKDRVNLSLRGKKTILYNYFTRQLLDDVITFYDNEKKITVLMDKPYSNRNLRESMNEYLSRMASRISASRLDILHEDSCKCAGIQFVDFIVGAVRRKYEAGDDTYMQKIKCATKKELFF